MSKTPTIPNDLLLYHYPASPYARRIVWYLSLRAIPYAEVIQPPYLPRPDLSLLSINYRRIPLLAHSRDVYLDSRFILSHLEHAFPHISSSPSLTPATVEGKSILRLLERYTTDAGIFSRAASLIPPSAPLLNDPKFQKDRAEFSGREFSPKAFEKGRPESLVVIRDLFELLEHTLLADGREWVVEGRLTLADVEAAWIVDWLGGMPGALPKEFGEGTYPKVLALVKRVSVRVKDAKTKMGRATRVTGEQAAEAVLGVEVSADGEHDGSDPLGLKQGETVTVWPVDSGSGKGHRDTGRLCWLSKEECVIEKTVGAGSVRVHAPRWGFRVVRGEGGGDARL